MALSIVLWYNITMEQAKIVLIEDDEGVASVAKLALEIYGHEVIYHTETRDEAMSTLNQIEEEELGVDVFLLDGKLSEESGLGEDAHIISQEIRTKQLGGIIIGFSSDKLPEDICDYQAPSKNILTVLNIIDSLPQ